jgi:hypothetical protein
MKIKDGIQMQRINDLMRWRGMVMSARITWAEDKEGGRAGAKTEGQIDKEDS